MSQPIHITIGILLVGAAAIRGAGADQSQVDQSRLEAARERAAMHWASAGYDALPPRLNAARVQESKDVSIVPSIADGLLAANPTRSAAVLDYINRVVI